MCFSGNELRSEKCRTKTEQGIVVNSLLEKRTRRTDRIKSHSKVTEFTNDELFVF